VQSLKNANSQLTFLHIVRMGSPPEGDEDDRRPWIVRVVRREATIGPHTFHLHEIYGLSSTSSMGQVDGVQHAYPPGQSADEQTSECLLCLSSPREVVLLPCRHLVACRECAVNMVEFGAGGNLVHAESEQPNTQPANGAASNDDANDPVVNHALNGEHNQTMGFGANSSAPTGAPRRKRKAKGWYCPVCRQPYTSLLRITTIPPEKDSARTSSSEDNTPSVVELPTSPQPVVTVTSNGLDVRNLLPRPNFLRSLSRSVNRTQPTGANMV